MQDRLIRTLKDKGYSLTKTRLALFSALQSGKPRTMRELTLDLSSVMDRASIYRTISLFEELGIVVRVQQGWKYKIELSDVFSPHHHHISCLKCGKNINFDEPKGLEEALDNIARQNNITHVSHSLEIIGICIDCK